MAARLPPRVVPGIALRREHVAQTAIPLVADDAWPAFGGPPPVELVADGGVVQVGWTNQLLHDLTGSGHPSAQLVSVDIALCAVTPPGS